eukprot:2752200-Prymnesium_polylepis.1
MPADSAPPPALIPEQTEQPHTRNLFTSRNTSARRARGITLPTENTQPDGRPQARPPPRSSIGTAQAAIHFCKDAREGNRSVVTPRSWPGSVWNLRGPQPGGTRAYRA